MEKIKITAEIPKYLKDWINKHDVSQNALVVMGLRKLFNDDNQADENVIVRKIITHIDNIKCPF